MKAKNHNTNREKRVMKKRFRTAVFLLLFAGIVLTVFRYFKLVSKTVYEESVSHLTEVFHQSDNMLRELTDKNLTYLHMWGAYLQETSDEDKIRDYIENAQKDAGFLNFYFLSTDGMILSILVYTLFSRMFDLMQPPAVKHSIAVV